MSSNKNDKHNDDDYDDLWFAEFENTHWKKVKKTRTILTVWLARFKNTHWKKVKKKFRRRG